MFEFVEHVCVWKLYALYSFDTLYLLFILYYAILAVLFEGHDP